MISQPEHVATRFTILDLPTEVFDEVWGFAFPELTHPTKFQFVVKKHERRRPGQQDTFTLDPQKFSLDAQTISTRILLALCPATRAMTLRHKPHTLTFETRRSEELKKRQRRIPCHYQYPLDDNMAIEDTYAIIRFNNLRDIICIDHGVLTASRPRPAPRHQLDDFNPLPLHLEAPPGFGKDIGILALYGQRSFGEEIDNDLLIAACPALRKLYISRSGSRYSVEAELERGDYHTVFASPRVCTSFKSGNFATSTVTCFIKDLQALEWGLKRAGLGMDTIPQIMIKALEICETIRCKLVGRGGVREDLQVLPLVSYVVEDFVIMTRRLRDIQNGQERSWNVEKERKPISLQKELLRKVLNSVEDYPDRFETAVAALGRTVT